jgi:glycosyltransferase involved in cell wall biosynthesis
VISVVLPTRNPHSDRLQRTLAGLAAQALSRSEWELVAVDSDSHPPLISTASPQLGELGARVVVEPAPGLTPARLAGIRAARGEVLVFVDDDNVLSRNYLAAVADRFAGSSALAAAGGPVIPEWEAPPPDWTKPFHGLLALRDLGPTARVARGGPGVPWPDFAPVGAGLAIRREFALAYADAVHRDPRRRSLDRRGASLASGGDNDLILTALHAGGDVAYFSELKLTHLIPTSRLNADYLARLNRGIMRTWVRVLALHGQCPWRPVARSTVPLRSARAWLRLRAWRGSAERVRWAGARGQFEGRADVHDWAPGGE